MTVTQPGSQDQAAVWNGTAGLGWVEAQGLLDRLFEPFERVLVDAVRTATARDVLDIGSGTGATTLAIARALGANGRAVGIDISEPMIALARARADRDGVAASFIVADAEAHAFEPQTFDMITSRFGVMFFSDPVRAFANLRRAARDAAAVRLIAWRDPEENPFMTVAERAAAPLLPNLPPRRPNEPGQFGFADRSHVRRVLESSGWRDVDISPLDVACAFPESELVRYFTRLGPLARVLPETDAAQRARIVETVRRAFEPYVHGGEVRFEAACWMIAAAA